MLCGAPYGKSIFSLFTFAAKINKEELRRRHDYITVAFGVRKLGSPRNLKVKLRKRRTRNGVLRGKRIFFIISNFPVS